MPNRSAQQHSCGSSQFCAANDAMRTSYDEGQEEQYDDGQYNDEDWEDEQYTSALDIAVKVVQRHVADTTGRSIDTVTRREALQLLDAKALEQDPVLCAVLDSVFSFTETYVTIPGAGRVLHSEGSATCLTTRSAEEYMADCSDSPDQDGTPCFEEEMHRRHRGWRWQRHYLSYLKQHGIALQHPNLPCLRITTTAVQRTRPHLLPLEMCGCAPKEDLCSGFSRLISTLRPSAADRQMVQAAASAFRHAAIQAAKDIGQVLSDQILCGVYTVGSWSRNTAFGGSDLDLLIVLVADDDNAFRVRRNNFFNAFIKLLTGSQDPDVECSLRQLARTGWTVVIDRPHWVCFRHLELSLHVDVQVCQAPFRKLYANGHWMRASSQETKPYLLAQLLMQASQGASQVDAAHDLRHDTSSQFNDLTNYRVVRSDVIAQREALLTPLLSDSIAKAASTYNLSEVLLSGVILAVKAWVKFGIADALNGAVYGYDPDDDRYRTKWIQPQKVDTRTKALLQSRRQTPKKLQDDHRVETQPPGLALEMAVLYTIEQQFREGGDAALDAYRMPECGELVLFMDCLQTMSTVFDLGMFGQQSSTSLSVVAPFDNPNMLYLTLFYTKRHLSSMAETIPWGGTSANIWQAHQPYCPTPVIVHPSDPTYNCAGHTGFRHWQVIADEAYGLFNEMLVALQYPIGDPPCWPNGRSYLAGPNGLMSQLRFKKFPSLQGWSSWQVVQATESTLQPVLDIFEHNSVE